MALKISLKPNEKIIIGGAVLANGNGKSCKLIIENNVPLLRQRDILGENDADTPCKRIYFVLQLMYIDEGNLPDHHNTYWKLVRDLLEAAPSMTGLIDQISEQVVNRRYYQALKTANHLIEYEQEILKHV